MTTEPRRLGKYELRERLARGGQGEVWKAFDPQLRRYVAIKVLNARFQSEPDFVLRFEREAQFIASLHHPNIVKIHDFQLLNMPDSTTSLAYMVMDYIEGPTLSEYISSTSRKGHFPSPSDVVSIFTAVSLALDYAHQKGMIHRDIKPANIMLDRRNPHGKPMGEPILMDFGIAKLQGGAAETTKVLGTPLYLSPEQAQGGVGDRRSDLYALGIILYEITTGVTPFRGDSVMAILMQHCNEMPTPPALINPEISSELSEVILRSIAKDPNDRYPSASAMTIALAEALKVPVPPELWKASTPSVRTSMLDSHNPLSLPPGITPLPGASSKVPSYPFSLSPTATPSSHGQQILSALVDTPVPVAPALPPPGSPLPTRARKPRPKTLLFFVALALLVVLGLGVGGYFLLAASHNPGLPGPTAGMTVGQVTFLNSSDTPGALNTVRISLPGIHDAPNGKSYYAWLLTRSDSVPPVFWALSVHGGSVSNALHTEPVRKNLLTNAAAPNTAAQEYLAEQPYLFIISLEDGKPLVPTPSSQRLYYATIPQRTSTTDTTSIVDHLNHLLTDDPNLDKLGKSFGLKYWLLKNTQALMQESTAVKTAQQNTDAAGLRQHLINIEYYLEGTSCAPADIHQATQEGPFTPDVATAQNVSISLLDCPQNATLSGLLTHIQLHMRGVLQAPSATHDQRTLAPVIETRLANLRTELEQIHQSTQQLLKLSDPQLLSSSQQPQLDQLITLTSAAANGVTTNQQASASQIGNDLQRLATFDISTCPASNATSVCMS